MVTSSRDCLKIDLDLKRVGWRDVYAVIKAVVFGGEVYVTARGLHFRFRFPPRLELRLYFNDDPDRIAWDEVRGRLGFHTNVLFNYKVVGGRRCCEERVWDVWGLIDTLDSKRLNSSGGRKYRRKRKNVGGRKHGKSRGFGFVVRGCR